MVRIDKLCKATNPWLSQKKFRTANSNRTSRMTINSLTRRNNMRNTQSLLPLRQRLPHQAPPVLLKPPKRELTLYLPFSILNLNTTPRRTQNISIEITSSNLRKLALPLILDRSGMLASGEVPPPNHSLFIRIKSPSTLRRPSPCVKWGHPPQSGHSIAATPHLEGHLPSQALFGPLPLPGSRTSLSNPDTGPILSTLVDPALTL